jgi:hypothetical protein
VVEGLKNIKVIVMSKIKSWMSHNPWKVVLLTMLFTCIPTVAVYRDDWLVPLLSLFAFGLLVFAFSAWRFGRHLPILLAVALAWPAKAEEQQAVPVAAGIVVICVG